jgi:hypothetical protein
MSDIDYLSLQANVICLLLFVLGTVAIFERPEWFYRVGLPGCGPMGVQRSQRRAPLSRVGRVGPLFGGDAVTTRADFRRDALSSQIIQVSLLCLRRADYRDSGDDSDDDATHCESSALM